MKYFKRIVGEHIASLVESKEEIRFAYSNKGIWVIIGNDVQLLPDSYGEDNPDGYFTSDNEARQAIKDYETTLKMGVTNAGN